MHLGWYDRKRRRVRDLSCADTRIYLEFEVRRVRCRSCGGVKRERLDFLADNPLYTKRFAVFVLREKLLQHHNKFFRVGEVYLYHYRLQQRFHPANIAHLDFSFQVLLNIVDRLYQKHFSFPNVRQRVRAQKAGKSLVPGNALEVHINLPL